VLSHLRIARRPEDIHAIRVPAGGADLVIGGDMVVASAKKVLAAVKRGQSRIIANLAEILPGDFTRNADFSLPAERIERAIRTSAGEDRSHFVDATRLATALLGNSIGANIFLVINGELHTPTPDCFLNGLTRQTVIALARQRGIKVVERAIMPQELAKADEVFLTGSAAEIVSVTQIDQYEGESITKNNFGATFFILTGFHGCHVFGGVTYLSAVLGRAARGVGGAIVVALVAILATLGVIVVTASTVSGLAAVAGALVGAGVVFAVVSALAGGTPVYSAHSNNEVEIAALYWHFVDLIWILVFTFVYLI